MLQDIGQGLFRNEYMPVPPQKEDIVFSFDGGKTLLREGEEGIEVPLVGSLKEAELPHLPVIFFALGKRSYYLWMGKEPLQKARFSYEIVRKFRLACPQASALRERRPIICTAGTGTIGSAESAAMRWSMIQ